MGNEEVIMRRLHCLTCGNHKEFIKQEFTEIKVDNTGLPRGHIRKPKVVVKFICPVCDDLVDIER